jgi:hypothetical protein
LRSALLDRFKLPDRDDIQSDLCSFGFKFNSQGLLVLESKIDLKKRGVPSPDTADAIALTFCDGPDGIVRVCPDTLGRITKFSKHEPN